MYYKRNEPYRYTFKNPITAQIIRSDDGKASIDVTIINISLNGLRIESMFPIEKDEKIIVSYNLLSQNFSLIGKVVWAKKIGKKYECGVTLNVDITYQNELTALLKQLAKARD